MSQTKKKLLIVDDSEIDRLMLIDIICEDFDYIEADNGYAALEILQKGEENLDAILLDISMPVVDGFSVLQLIRRKNMLKRMPVFMVTSEATQNNVQRAIQYNVSEFIKKPFERTEVLRRLRTKLGVVAYSSIKAATKKDIITMKDYISRLEKVYINYLVNFGRDFGHYKRMTELMGILLSKYAVNNRVSLEKKGERLDGEMIEIISKAAAFCDIGFMMMPDKYNHSQTGDSDNPMLRHHTKLGVDIIQLNNSKHCEYFMQICSDMCLHHHEKYDGTGYPDGLYGNSIYIYTQMCRLVNEFDDLYSRYYEHNEKRFDLVISELEHDKGGVGSEVFALLKSCKGNILRYYNNMNV